MEVNLENMPVNILSKKLITASYILGESLLKSYFCEH